LFEEMEQHMEPQPDFHGKRSCVGGEMPKELSEQRANENPGREEVEEAGSS
jgi:hypothetical protein